MLKTIFLVTFGGAIGSLLRFGTGLWFCRFAFSGFPYATLTVNVVGCFLIGLFYSLTERYEWFASDGRLLLITGFCGGFTTFSAFAYENIRLLQQGNSTIFLLNSVGTFALTLLAVWGGIHIGKLF